MEVTREEMNGKPGAALNSTRICRFCLSPAGVMSPIFEQGEINSLPLSSKIMAFISIQVYVNDGLPSLICHRCLYQVEKSYDFKTQCEASDAMLRKYLTAFQASCDERGGPFTTDSSEIFDSFNLSQLSKSIFHHDSPFKRKRGRPRKEENMMFYGSQFTAPLDFCNGLGNYADDEIKFVDGIESVVTVVDPRSEILSNSDDENKMENGENNETKTEVVVRCDNQTMDSLAIAKAKAKKYMGVVIGMDDNGMRTRRHLCKGCGKTFAHCSDLRKHVLVHTGERPFHCRICTKTFSRSTNLNKHMKVHTGQKPYFCTDCPKSFATKGDLQRHLIIHSGIKPFGCHLCNQCFSRKDKLTRHLKLHENGNLSKLNFKCEACSIAFNSKSDLNEHAETVHPFPEKKFAAEENAEAVECEGDALESSKPTNELLEKIKVEEPISDKTLVVKDVREDSSRELETSPEEVESMVINLDPFQMDSDLSEVLGTWENDKSGHYSKIDGEISEQKPESIDDANYAPRNGTEKFSLQCKICYKKFSEFAYLRSHMVTHSAVKPHKCTMCDKSFTRRRELLRHENVHTGFKPFKCDTCGKAFSRKDKLVRHEKIHNGVQKYPCTVCPSASFLKIDDLISHHRSSHSDVELPYVLPTNPHAGIKYQCEICLVCYGNLKMYQDHVKTHNGNNNSDLKKMNGTADGTDSDCLNSEDEKLTDSSFEQLNSNAAITVTSVSKAFGSR